MTLTAMTKEQLKNLDATASTVGISTDVLMERAGMMLAEFLREHVRADQTVLLLCGPGNNGGDGYVAARHLTHQGIAVSVAMSQEPTSAVAKKNKKLVEHMGIPVKQWEKGFSFTPYDVLVDCLLGYGQEKAPTGIIADIVVAAQESGRDVYACDIPTGVDANDGVLYEPHISAKQTVSFAAPKQGFMNLDAQSACGTITITGIGIPAFVYKLIIPVGDFLIEGTSQYP